MNTIVLRITSAPIAITRAALRWPRPPLARTLGGRPAHLTEQVLAGEPYV
jgi:hypothetical protein